MSTIKLPDVGALLTACRTFLNACRCPLCSSPWRKASTFPCGHTFCYDCAIATIEGPGISQSECPTCGAKFWKRDLRHNHRLIGVVEHAQKILGIEGTGPSASLGADGAGGPNSNNGPAGRAAGAAPPAAEHVQEGLSGPDPEPTGPPRARQPSPVLAASAARCPLPSATRGGTRHVSGSDTNGEASEPRKGAPKHAGTGLLGDQEEGPLARSASLHPAASAGTAPGLLQAGSQCGAEGIPREAVLVDAEAAAQPRFVADGGSRAGPAALAGTSGAHASRLLDGSGDTHGHVHGPPHGPLGPVGVSGGALGVPDSLAVAHNHSAQQPSGVVPATPLSAEPDGAAAFTFQARCVQHHDVLGAAACMAALPQCSGEPSHSGKQAAPPGMRPAVAPPPPPPQWYGPGPDPGPGMGTSDTAGDTPTCGGGDAHSLTPPCGAPAQPDAGAPSNAMPLPAAAMATPCTEQLLRPLPSQAPPPWQSLSRGMAAYGTDAGQRRPGSVVSIRRGTPGFNNAYLEFHSLLEEPVNYPVDLEAGAGCCGDWASFNEAAFFRQLARLPAPLDQEREALAFELQIVEVFLRELDKQVALQVRQSEAQPEQRGRAGVDASAAVGASPGAARAVEAGPGADAAAAAGRSESAACAGVAGPAAAFHGVEGDGNVWTCGDRGHPGVRLTPPSAGVVAEADAGRATAMVAAEDGGLDPHTVTSPSRAHGATAGVAMLDALEGLRCGAAATAPRKELGSVENEYGACGRPSSQGAGVACSPVLAEDDGPGARSRRAQLGPGGSMGGMAGVLAASAQIQAARGPTLGALNPMAEAHLGVPAGAGAPRVQADPPGKIPQLPDALREPPAVEAAATDSIAKRRGTAAPGAGDPGPQPMAPVSGDSEGDADDFDPAVRRKRPRRAAVAEVQMAADHPVQLARTVCGREPASSARERQASAVVSGPSGAGHRVRDGAPPAAARVVCVEQQGDAHAAPLLVYDAGPGLPAGGDRSWVHATDGPPVGAPGAGPELEKVAGDRGDGHVHRNECTKQFERRRKRDPAPAKRRRGQGPQPAPADTDQALPLAAPDTAPGPAADPAKPAGRQRGAARRGQAREQQPGGQSAASLPTEADGGAAAGAAASRRMKPLYVLSTGLSAQEREKLRELGRRVRGLDLLEDVTPTMTHLVVSLSPDGRAASRTVKYLRAVMQGCWVVGSKWADACLSAGRLLPEGPYEATGDPYHEGTPAKGRLRVQRGEPGLFAGLNFCVTYLKGQMEGKVFRADVEALLQAAGGCIVRRQPSRTAASETTPAAAIFGSVALAATYNDTSRTQLQSQQEPLQDGDAPSDRVQQQQQLPAGLPPVLVLLSGPNVADAGRVVREWGYAPISTSWVYDSISYYQVLPVDAYLVVPESQNHTSDLSMSLQG